MKVGLDVGSTTIKTIILDDNGQIVYSAYERHFAQITAKALEALVKVREAFPADTPFSLVISGSAGMGMAEHCGVDFAQEVYATKVAAEKNAPDTDVIIELGGEDAKIIFLRGAMEARMNGSCAGGTGAFIDQMATLLGITPDEMNDYAGESTKLYTIASRCGVFAKSDIQPLINQGADKRDISASIFSAVVNQTIGGLAQGRAIEGNVLYLGGPLTFMPELRKSFDQALSLKGNARRIPFILWRLGLRFAPGSRWIWGRWRRRFLNMSRSTNSRPCPHFSRMSRNTGSFRNAMPGRMSLTGSWKDMRDGRGSGSMPVPPPSRQW